MHGGCDSEPLLLPLVPGPLAVSSSVGHPGHPDLALSVHVDVLHYKASVVLGHFQATHQSILNLQVLSTDDFKSSHARQSHTEGPT